MSDSKGMGAAVFGCIGVVGAALVTGVLTLAGVLITSGKLDPPTPVPSAVIPTFAPAPSLAPVIPPNFNPTPVPPGPPPNSVRADGKWNSYATLRENACNLQLSPFDSNGFFLREVVPQDGIISNLEAVNLHDGFDRYLATGMLNWPNARFEYNAPPFTVLVTMQFSNHSQGRSQWVFNYSGCLAVYRDY